MSKREPSFTVTAAGQTVNLDASGAAQAPFTVTNTGAQTLRGRLLTRPVDPAKPEWFSIVGESVRDFASNAAEQVVVQLSVPPGTAPGSYSFRLDAVSEADPDEDFTEGPSVAFDVAAPPPPKKKFPWWILAIIGAVVLLAVIIGVVVFLLDRDGGGDPSDFARPSRQGTCPKRRRKAPLRMQDSLSGPCASSAGSAHETASSSPKTQGLEAQAAEGTVVTITVGRFFPFPTPPPPFRTPPPPPPPPSQ